MHAICVCRLTCICKLESSEGRYQCKVIHNVLHVSLVHVERAPRRVKITEEGEDARVDMDIERLRVCRGWKVLHTALDSRQIGHGGLRGSYLRERYVAPKLQMDDGERTPDSITGALENLSA